MAIGHEDTTRDRDERGERRHGRREERTATDWAKQAATLVGGLALLVRGLRRGSLRGIASAVVGGWLVSRALGGTENVERSLRSATEPGGWISGLTEAGEPVSVSRSVTVGEPADDLYEVWRDPDQLSRIVGHVAEVSSAGEDRLRWTVDAPRGRELSWETRFVEDEPGERLRWESAEGATVPTEGEVRFRDAPGDRGTVVTLSIGVEPPGGELGTAALRRLDVLPGALVGTALDRFKSLVETGEIPTLVGNSSGRGRGDRL